MGRSRDGKHQIGMALFPPIIESDYERSTLQFMNLNLLTTKLKEK